MASGYQTSDGVDLDSRYLGINAKAKSAATADIASTANSVSWNSVTGKPDLSKGWKGFSDLISFGSNKTTWTAPSDGVCIISVDFSASSYTTIYVNGEKAKVMYGDAPPIVLALTAGQTVMASPYDASGTFCKVA